MALVCLGAVAPLAPEQREAMSRWIIDPATLDEPGLYVLLNNAADWPDPVAEQARGERLADLEAVEADPARWRGEPLVVEGALLGVMDATGLTERGVLLREGWEGLEAWTIETDPAGDGAPGRKALVVLIDPPDAPSGRIVGDQRVMTRPFPKVRTVGRFFKSMELPTGGGGTARFPVFVGKTARFDGLVGGRSGRNGEAGDGSGYAAGALVLLAVALIVAFMVIRRVGRRGEGPLSRRLEEARARREADEDRTRDAFRDDLPEDPIEALGALASERDIEIDEARGRLDDEAERRGRGDDAWSDDDAKRSG